MMKRMECLFVVVALCALSSSAFAATQALDGANEQAVGEARQPFMEMGRYAKSEAPSVLAASVSDMADQAKLAPARKKTSAEFLEDISVVKNAGAAGHLVNVPAAMVGAATWGIDEYNAQDLPWAAFLIPVGGQVALGFGVLCVAMAGIYSMLGNLGAAISEAAKGHFGMTKD